MYLNVNNKSRSQNGFIKKSIRIMKLTTVLLFATILQVSAKDALTQKVTLKESIQPNSEANKRKFFLRG